MFVLVWRFGLSGQVSCQSGFEVGGERGIGVAEGDDYGFGVAFGALCAGVGVVDGEEERGFFGAEGFKAIGFYGGHVDDGNLLFGWRSGGFGRR